MEYEQKQLPLAFETYWATLDYTNGKWVDKEVKPSLLIENKLPNTEPG